MMKEYYKALALLMAAALANEGNRYRKEPINLGKELTDQGKLKRHREFSSDQTMHEYTINGVVIKATSKKVALKIYRRNNL